MVALLTLNQARTLGLKLNATADELDALMRQVMHKSIGFSEVRAWFDARLETVSPPTQSA